KFSPGPADSCIYAGDSSSPSNNPAKVMAERGIRWKEANKGPGSRKAGWQEIRSRLKGAIPGPDGTRDSKGHFFFESCPEAIRQLRIITRDKKDRDEIDSATKEDRLADEVRYRCMFVPSVLKVRFF